MTFLPVKLFMERSQPAVPLHDEGSFIDFLSLYTRCIFSNDTLLVYIYINKELYRYKRSAFQEWLEYRQLLYLWNWYANAEV